MRYARKITIHGICQVTKKWVKTQYKDDWDDENMLYLPHDAWKSLDKPWLGDKLLMEVTRR